MKILTWLKDWWNSLSSAARMVLLICAAFLVLHLFVLKLDFVALALLAVIFLILYPDILREIETPGEALRVKEDYEKKVAPAGWEDPRILRRDAIAGALLSLAVEADRAIKATSLRKIFAVPAYEQKRKEIFKAIDEIIEEIVKEEAEKVKD